MKNSGFTLIELLVSLTILSLVSMIGYHGIMYAVKNSNKSYLLAENVHEKYAATAWLREKINTADEKTYTENNITYTYFSGNSNQLEFICNLGKTGSYRKYLCKVMRDHNKLVVTYRENYNQGSKISKNYLTLLDDVKGLSFSYYGIKGEKYYAWHDNWERMYKLPRLVSVKYADKKGTNEMVIYIKTSNG